jgi:hypothetical protein
MNYQSTLHNSPEEQNLIYVMLEAQDHVLSTLVQQLLKSLSKAAYWVV